AIAAAVSRLAGSAKMFSLGKFPSNFRTAFSCSAFVRTRMRSGGTSPSRRASVSSSKALLETRLSSCLGRARLLNGQNRSPLPPARISAYIESGMSLQGIESRKLPFLFPKRDVYGRRCLPSYPFQKVLKSFQSRRCSSLLELQLGSVWEC